jgi:hypothetical protein
MSKSLKAGLNKELEHHVFDSKGKDVGLLIINPFDVQGVDMWQRVDRLITEYSQVFPSEMYLILFENGLKRREMRNKYGSNKSKTLRLGASIPPGLYYKINQIYPEIFNQKPLFRQFMRRYKGFRIPETI